MFLVRKPEIVEVRSLAVQKLNSMPGQVETTDGSLDPDLHVPMAYFEAVYSFLNAQGAITPEFQRKMETRKRLQK